MRPINESDLHLEYKMVTGKDHCHGKDSLSKNTHYTREYFQWMEEKLVEQLNIKKNVKELEETVYELKETNAALGEDIYDLEYEIGQLNNIE